MIDTDEIYVSDLGVGVVCGSCGDFKEWHPVKPMIVVFWCLCTVQKVPRLLDNW